MLKNFFLIAAFCSSCFLAQAQNLRTPAPSPTQTVRQDFGIGAVELSYSRPAMKGRKIFGDLVPFDKVWRTGANSATTLNFSDTVVIGGTRIAPGKYGLLTIPGKDQWTIVISKQLDVTSPAAYQPERDVVRVTAKTTALKDAVENFTIQFNNLKSSSMDLQIMWANTAVAFPISTDIDGRIMGQINAVMNNDNRPYFSAAMYYMENGKDLKQALAWLDKAVEQNPGAFYMHHQRANALARLGRKEEARKAAQLSMQLAVEQKSDDYVKLNEKLLEALK